MKHAPPPVLSGYFASVNTGRAVQAAACFAPDALVHNESQDHQGAAAILAWVEDSTSKYSPKAEMGRMAQEGETLAAAGIVSGTFPESPLSFDCRFTVRDRKISKLANK